MTKLFLVLVFFMGIQNIHAQIATTVLLQGRAVEKKSQKPLAAKYEIHSAEGKIIRGKTIESDGSFQQVLTPGEKYTISFWGESVYMEADTIALRPSSSYYEEKRSFAVQKLRSGEQVAGFNAFAAGSAEIVPEARERLKRIFTAFKHEDMPSLVIELTDETPKTKKAKGSKDKAASVNSLAEQRSQALADLVAESGKHAQAKIDIKIVKSKAKQNLSLRVGKIVS